MITANTTLSAAYNSYMSINEVQVNDDVKILPVNMFGTVVKITKKQLTVRVLGYELTFSRDGSKQLGNGKDTGNFLVKPALHPREWVTFIGVFFKDKGWVVDLNDGLKLDGVQYVNHITSDPLTNIQFFTDLYRNKF